jgi:hypothetical protein
METRMKRSYAFAQLRATEIALRWPDVAARMVVLMNTGAHGRLQPMHPAAQIASRRRTNLGGPNPQAGVEASLDAN